jgi:hypothetical protein
MNKFGTPNAAIGTPIYKFGTPKKTLGWAKKIFLHIFFMPASTYLPHPPPGLHPGLEIAHSGLGAFF